MIPRELHAQNLRALLSPVSALLDRPDVSEIMINGPHAVYVERAGRVEATDCRFEDTEALMCAVRGIAQFAGRHADADSPILEARLPDGSRVEAVLPPAAPDGPVLTIRRFAKTAFSTADLIAKGSLSEAGARLLSAMVEARDNIVVAGGTGSGKTSLLNSLSGIIPRDQRIVVIEDARELSLPHEHVVHLEARPPDARGRGEVGVRQLFKAALRLRPDRIVLGEIRGGEALELIQAMTSGHDGCLSTVHATSPADALARLETMALMSDVELPLTALRAQLASAVDAIVQIRRDADGRRRISEVARVHARGMSHRLERVYPAQEQERCR